LKPGVSKKSGFCPKPAKETGFLEKFDKHPLRKAEARYGANVASFGGG
jgi:hypothetical protein